MIEYCAGNPRYLEYVLVAFSCPTPLFLISLKMPLMFFTSDSLSFADTLSFFTNFTNL